jgi:predicted nucleic acid-binding protein
MWSIGVTAMDLVDSDVLIAHLRGMETAKDWLRQERSAGPLAVSAVSVTEITGGMRSAERREVWQLPPQPHQNRHLSHRRHS